MGRRKLILPIYAELLKTPEGLAFAKDVFAKAKPATHPITAGTILDSVARGRAEQMRIHYMSLPVGRLRLRHALIGGVTAALLWEVTRRLLVLYFATLSQVNVVYGSLTTAIVVLLSLEIAATLLLLGAQVISEYERIAVEPIEKTPKPAQIGEPA